MPRPVACIANIGPKGQQRRLAVAGVVLAVCVAAAFFLPYGWRFLLFVPLWFAALCFFQALDKT